MVLVVGPDRKYSRANEEQYNRRLVMGPSSICYRERLQGEEAGAERVQTGF